MAVKRATKVGPEYGGRDEETEWEVSYEGCVLGTFERNGYDDSDFYAIVWTGSAIGYIEYASTRAWTYANGAQVDASEEVKDAAQKWTEDRLYENYLSVAREEAKLLRRGGRARVKKSGEEGRVFWTGVDRFKSNRWATHYRVGIMLDSGEKKFLAANGVESLAEVAVDEGEARRRAQRAAAEVRRSEAWRTGVECSWSLMRYVGKEVA